LTKKRTILDAGIIPSNGQPERRRQLLPIWIKVFCWIFIAMALPLIINFYLYISSHIYLRPPIYGLDKLQNIPYSDLAGHLILLFKTTIAFGLWTERKQAVKLAFVDAYLGVIIHSTVYYILPFFRPAPDISTMSIIEFALLLPYLLILYRIRSQWVSLQRLQ